MKELVIFDLFLVGGVVVIFFILFVGGLEDGIEMLRLGGLSAAVGAQHRYKAPLPDGKI